VTSNVTGCPTNDVAESCCRTLVVVDAGSTWCGLCADVLVRKFAVPGYVAVTCFSPAVVGVSWQLPDPPLRVAGQVAPVPSLTVTVPVGVPVPGATGATLTATVNAWPTTVAADMSFVMVVAVDASDTT
jgi:hypothetical protein